ncbi:restriction endonuclease subunit S [Propionivibrio sp.]|uniref:restriction endonuclease subunit S n=1 Tax=Propionivibrio sp. TaxID=2212460 RepID=UPI00272DD12E|nr:restriction endonuclease subunit S [Propionivibrio sp.]
MVDYGSTTKAEPSQISSEDWVLELEDIEKDSSKLLQRMTFAQRQSKSTKSRFQAGDVLYGKLRPYLNKVLIADQPGYCTTEIVPIETGAQLDNRYLFYWLKHPAFLKYVEAESHGMNMPRLGTDTAKAAPLVLAPRNEQTRIADQLDKLLARIQSCNDRLDAIPALLKRFRQAVLSAVTSGALTEDWRAGAEPSYKHVSLGALISDGPQNGLYKHSSSYGAGAGILRIDMFYDGEVTGWDVMKRLKVDASELDTYGLSVGDIVVNRVNSPPYVGKAALIREVAEPTVFESNMMRIRLDEEQVLPEYCIRFLSSPEGLLQLRRNVKHAVNQSSINQTDVKSVQVPLPCVAEQAEIVRRVEALFKLADRIEARHTAACTQAQRLAPLLLAKAFRGELVPQDPNDEPASALLERISAEREKAAAQPRPRKSSVGRKPVRAPNENASMIKSRIGDDVQAQP